MEHKSSGKSHKTFTYPGGQNVALIFIDQYFSRKHHEPTNSWYISIIPFFRLKSEMHVSEVRDFGALKFKFYQCKGLVNVFVWGWSPLGTQFSVVFKPYAERKG